MLEIECTQNSEEWERARLGIPTASDFGKLLTGTGQPSKQIDDYAAQLAAESYAETPQGSFKGNAATERGHALEDEAADHYAFMTDREITRVGFCIEELGPNVFAGCSPDRFVKIPGRGHHPGLLEIKCLGAAKHVLVHRYFAKNGKPEPAYIAQCQGQLLITGRKWLDLYFYHPELPELTIRIRPDEAYRKKLLEQITLVNQRRDELVRVLLEAA